MSALRLVATVLCLAACRHPAAEGPGGATLPVTDVPQSAIASGYPAGKTTYHCQHVKDGKLVAFMDPVFHFTVEKARFIHHSDGKERIYTLDDEDSAYEQDDAYAREMYRFVLLDGLIYRTEQPRASPEGIAFVCAPADQASKLGRVNIANHEKRLVAYRSERQSISYKAAVAAREAKEQQAKAAETAPFTDEELAQIARARTMTSFTFEASASNKNQPLSLRVNLTLADGSAMEIGYSSRIFKALFDVERSGNDVAMLVEVIPLDADGAEQRSRLVYKEITYAFVGERIFACEGAAGAVGSEAKPGGGIYYQGQPGEAGPDLTVEIATVAAPSGQALRYRLTCGDKRQVFNASADTEVHVSTQGGKGGHGVPLPKGDGTNGGDGGDGGDITVIVDPTVKRYSLTHTSIGGKGGAASDRAKTNSYTYGTPGRDGASGSFTERRAPVTIP